MTATALTRIKRFVSMPALTAFHSGARGLLLRPDRNICLRCAYRPGAVEEQEWQTKP